MKWIITILIFTGAIFFGVSLYFFVMFLGGYSVWAEELTIKTEVPVITTWDKLPLELTGETFSYHIQSTATPQQTINPFIVSQNSLEVE